MKTNSPIIQPKKSNSVEHIIIAVLFIVAFFGLFFVDTFNSFTGADIIQTDISSDVVISTTFQSPLSEAAVASLIPSLEIPSLNSITGNVVDTTISQLCMASPDCAFFQDDLHPFGCYNSNTLPQNRQGSSASSLACVCTDRLCKTETQPNLIMKVAHGVVSNQAAGRDYFAFMERGHYADGRAYDYIGVVFNGFLLTDPDCPKDSTLPRGNYACDLIFKGQDYPGMKKSCNPDCSQSIDNKNVRFAVVADHSSDDIPALAGRWKDLTTKIR